MRNLFLFTLLSFLFASITTTAFEDNQKNNKKSEEVISKSLTTTPNKTLMKIWVEHKGKCVVLKPFVNDFLNKIGYGELNDKEFIKRGKDGILTIVNDKIVSKFIFHYYKQFDEKYFQDPNLLGVKYGEKPILDSQIENIINHGLMI